MASKTIADRLAALEAFSAVERGIDVDPKALAAAVAAEPESTLAAAIRLAVKGIRIPREMPQPTAQDMAEVDEVF